MLNNLLLKNGEVAASAKIIADRFKKELDFVMRPTLERAEQPSEIEIAGHQKACGFCHFHCRKDGQTTIYSLAVLQEYQKQGWGRLLFYKVLCAAIEAGSDRIVLKCPENMPSNNFYKHLGFEMRDRLVRKNKRTLNVWQYKIKLPVLFYSGSENTMIGYGLAAKRAGWHFGCRSDKKSKERMGFLDIDWKNPNPKAHQARVEQHKPLLACVLDVETPEQIKLAAIAAQKLIPYCGRVLVIPKCKEAYQYFNTEFKEPFWWGYSVASNYGNTEVHEVLQDGRPCHLLGGSAKKQAILAKSKDRNIVSLDYNQTQPAQAGKISTAWGDRVPRFEEVASGKGFCYRCLEESLKQQKTYWHLEKDLCPIQLSLFE
ncbi:MAG: GNAT family N-acetyltransferase [Oscillatoria sp. SIO1A7]|nr:GNAT family N-acetyltransferase [Oscillatoria sp. SIO1A7]